MEPLPITSVIAAALAIILSLLSFLIYLERMNAEKQDNDLAKNPIDHGNYEPLKRCIAAFNSLSQYSPMALIMLALIEFDGASSILIWTLGIAFILGRLLHIYGMLNNPHHSLFKIIAMFTTYAILLVPAGWILFT